MEDLEINVDKALWHMKHTRDDMRDVVGGGKYARSEEVIMPTYAVSFMYEGWAVAQIVPCIHRGNCPSSWAVAQGPFSAANIYTEPLFLGSCPVRLLGGAEIWLSLKKAAQGSHGRVAILKNSHGPSKMRNCPKIMKSHWNICSCLFC